MKKILSTSEAADLLCADEYAAWSYQGARAMVEYLENIEEETGEEIEFDRVGIRCDYSEYSSLEDWASCYHGSTWRDVCGLDADADEDATEEAIRAYIEDRGTLIEFHDGVIVEAF